MLQFGASLTDKTRSVNYNHNTFIIQATGYISIVLTHVMVVLLLPVLLQGPQVLLRQRLLLDGDLKKGGKFSFLVGNGNFGGGKFKFWREIQILWA
jgi:hypothetical protein